MSRAKITSNLSSRISHKKQLQMDVPAVLVVFIKYWGICTFCFVSVVWIFFFFRGFDLATHKKTMQFPMTIVRWHDILVFLSVHPGLMSLPKPTLWSTHLLWLPLCAHHEVLPVDHGAIQVGNPENGENCTGGLWVVQFVRGRWRVFKRNIKRGFKLMFVFSQTFLFLVMLKGDMYCGKNCK